MRDERSTPPGWDAPRFRVVHGTAWLGCSEPNMRSVNDVEAYLGKMSRQFSLVEDQPGTFLVHGGANMPPTALRVDPPLVVLRVHVGDVEGSDDANGPLFKKLLTLNARSLVHASFGLEDNHIVLVSALELENLDYNELEATLDEIDVTLAQQVPTLAELSKAASVRPRTEKGNA
jgi:hypothetical protein